MIIFSMVIFWFLKNIVNSKFVRKTVPTPEMGRRKDLTHKKETKKSYYALGGGELISRCGPRAFSPFSITNPDDSTGCLEKLMSNHLGANS